MLLKHKFELSFMPFNPAYNNRIRCCKIYNHCIWYTSPSAVHFTKLIDPVVQARHCQLQGDHQTALVCRITPQRRTNTADMSV